MDWYYATDGSPNGPHLLDAIQELIRSGTLKPDTLVWRTGMPDWAAARDTVELREVLDRVPPPIPHTPPSPAPNTEETVSSDDSANPNRLDVVQPLNLAGPWSRYFARVFDVSVLASLLIFLAGAVTPYIAPSFYLWLVATDARLLFLIFLPVAHLVNAGIIWASGNSLGKALFGIKAIPADRSSEFSLRDIISREFRVWSQGLGIGIPFVTLFTMIAAFRKVKEQQPASYDLGTAQVVSYSDNPTRRAVAMVLVTALLVGIQVSNFIDKTEQQRTSVAQTWRNPESGLSATIPAGWRYEAVTADSGEKLHSFTNNNTGVVAYLAVETAQNLTIAKYADALKRSLSKTATIGEWTYSSGDWITQGYLTKDKQNINVTVRQIGNRFWRVVYVDALKLSPNTLGTPALTRALFGTTS